MANLQGIIEQTGAAGAFRIFVTPPGGARQEITLFRGAPVTVTQMAWADPFSEETAQLSCPMITPWDNLGQPGTDVSWVQFGADVDIMWQPAAGSPITIDWRWEGWITSFDFGVQGADVSFNLQLKGAIFALDNFLAAPSFPQHPLPYEWLMRSAFDPEQHPCSLAPLDVQFPGWWNITVPANDDYTTNLLRPAGVVVGTKWTGLSTRSTGNWNPLLTGYVQSLLQVMWNADGSQWTIRNRGGRAPRLMVREVPQLNDANILNVDLGAPGVDLQLSKDFSQMINVVYGSGSDLTGVAFTNLQMSSDGQTVGYEPFAWNPAAYPRSGRGLINPFYNTAQKMRESFQTFQQGLTQDQAKGVAQGVLQRFNDPGMTGTITLTSDPYLSDAANSVYLRLLIKAGMTIRVNGLTGDPAGVLFHIGEVQIDPVALTATLTVDTKYRDLLTIDEVNARVLDPLKTLHTLQNSATSNVIQDLLLPWSYSDGSGAIPFPAKDFYNTMPATEVFPYSNATPSTQGLGWCQKYPPSQYPQYYVKINPVDTNDSHSNWATLADNARLDPTGHGLGTKAIPILLSQAGRAASIQIAAYDKLGNVMPVKFHVSLYTNGSVNPDMMPIWGKNTFLDSTHYVNQMPPILTPSTGALDFENPHNYDPAADASIPTVPHPFFQGAWQDHDEQGHLLTGIVNQYLPNSSAGMVIGWGTYYVPAGYWPQQAGAGSPTGMMVDTTTWTWDTSATLNAQSLNPLQSAVGYMGYAGRLYAMIYCEDQGSEPVYFLGKIILDSQGAQT